MIWLAAWPILRRLLPYLAALGAIYGAYWYVSSLRADITQGRADLALIKGERNDALSSVKSYQANIRERIRADAANRANDAEVAALLKSSHARASDTAGRLREYRQAAATVPAAADPAASVEPVGRACAPTEPAGRSAAVDQACAETDEQLTIFKSELLRINQALKDLAEAQTVLP